MGKTGIDTARELAGKEGGLGRIPTGWQKYLISGIAVTWSLFQLALPQVILLDTIYIRAIHLAFAMTLVFLNYPLMKKPIPGMRSGMRCFSSRKTVPFLDIALAGASCFAALYLVIFLDAVNNRQGAPVTADIVFGVLLTVLLLEAARRAIGPALTVISLLFIGYCFLGPYMPDLIAFKGTSINRFVGQMTMSTEGIYGIPLDVSATIVFLFVLFGAMLDKAGAGQYFIQLALSLLGRFKGGPA